MDKMRLDGQADLCDFYAPIFDVAEWITDEIYDMEYDELDTAFNNVMKQHQTHDFKQFMQDNAQHLSELIRAEFELVRTHRCPNCGEIFNPYGNYTQYCSKGCKEQAAEEMRFDEMRERLNEIENYEID